MSQDNRSLIEPEIGPQDPQMLLILVGLPGSGKTTLAEAIIQHFGRVLDDSSADSTGSRRTWIRASQDDAPSRRRQECETLVRNGLRQGDNVIVDRVGFDAVQRSHFVNIADQHHPRPQVYALYLEVSIPTLETRLASRTSHPTIADPQTAMMVLRDMNRQLRLPTTDAREGFDRIYTLTEGEQPSDGIWSAERIERILAFVESEGDKETVPRRPIATRPLSNHAGGRGRGYGPDRGRGRGYWGDRGRGSGGGHRDRGGYHPSYGSQPPPPPGYRYPQPTGNYDPGLPLQPAPIPHHQANWRARSDAQTHARDRPHPYSLPTVQHDLGSRPSA